MALRATSDPTASTKSMRVGERVEFRAKVENTGSGEESVSLFVEQEKSGFPFSFDPPAIAIPPKSRKAIAFWWIATLPEGKDALTFRGRLELRHTTDGALAGSAPLDLYVTRG